MIVEHTIRFAGGPNNGHEAKVSASAGVGVPCEIHVTGPDGETGVYVESPLGDDLYVWAGLLESSETDN